MNWLMRILGKGKKKRAGFTLIELMVVVIVVGILAAAAIPIYRFAMSRAYSSEAKATMGTMMSSMKVFYAENNNAYPTFVWGESSESDESADILSILGVDTDTNTWWHAGFEGGSAASPITASFGTVIAGGSLPVTITKITPLGTAVGPYVWADGDIAGEPIEDIEVVYDVGDDQWYTAF